jgi:hypothetical protein
MGGKGPHDKGQVWGASVSPIAVCRLRAVTGVIVRWRKESRGEGGAVYML